MNQPENLSLYPEPAYMTADDLKRLCFEVSRFSRKGDLRPKAKPVIAWEFESMNEFYRTQSLIRRAMDAELVLSATCGENVISSDTMEFECMGVTFRLTCKQLKAMPNGGVYGATGRLVR